MPLEERINESFNEDDGEVLTTKQDILNFVKQEKKRTANSVVKYIVSNMGRISSPEVLQFVKKLVTLIKDRFNLDEK